MATKKKMLQAAAGNATGGGAALDITDVFSTYLYAGNDTSQTITNGIDLSGEGGMTWLKTRNDTHSHYLFDTERGAGYYLNSDDNGAQSYHATAWVTAFNSDGFDIGYSAAINDDVNNHASWTFRKAPKFFDVVTYTGTGSAQTIAHNLGCAPGCIIVKATSTTQGWPVYHRSLGGSNKFLVLNLTNSVLTSSNYFGDPTDTNFTVVSDNGTNGSGVEYVAYLFAHNDGDGEFGPDGDADIIKCGSFNSGGSAAYVDVDLGWEPQYILWKTNQNYTNWYVWDTMRGITTGGSDSGLFPNTSGAESAAGDYIDVTSTGFRLTPAGWNGLIGPNYDTVYIAIRRGPLAPPESGTEVFEPVAYAGTGSANTVTSNVDFSGSGSMALLRSRNLAESYALFDSTRGDDVFLRTNSADGESSDPWSFDFNNSGFSMSSADGQVNASGENYISWLWKRAPNFFDVVAYTGDGVAGRTVSHNLGVAPEMMWVKSRTSADNWYAYHKDLTSAAYSLILNQTTAAYSSPTTWNSTAPTDSVFTVGSDGGINGSTKPFIAYLFASLDGVSKVGSYTGNGTSQTIDCGFTSGARFVLIKRTDEAGWNWIVFDTARGIVTGNDPFLALNDPSAESSLDLIDPDSSGFTLASSAGGTNASGANYIFYAIA